MPTFKFRGEMTVSCWTHVEAETAEEAREEAEARPVASLVYHPFSGDADEFWHFENDGEPQEISLDD